MMKLFCSLLAFMTLSTFVFAQDTQIVKGEQSEWTLVLAGVSDQITLVESERTISVCDEGECLDRLSNLRVSALVYDSGPSTDVSEPFGLYLTMHNSIEEHAVASSTHLIAYISRLTSAKRIKAGIYEFKFDQMDFSSAQVGADNSCLIKSYSARVDARDLSVQVRKGEKTAFFEDASYQDPIYITTDELGCAG